MKSRIPRFSLSALAAAAFGALFPPAAATRIRVPRAQLGGVDMSEPEVKAALDKISDKVKEIAEQAIAEAKSATGVAKATKEKADEALSEQAKIKATLETLQAEVTDVLQKAQRTAAAATAPSTPGEEVVNADAFKAYVAAGDYKNAKFSMQLKAVTNITSATTGTGGAGDLIPPDRRPGMLMVPDRRLTVRDLLTPGRTNSNLIQYVQETGYQNMAATVAEGAAKPKSDLAFDLKSTPVVKIATYVKASTEILADAPMLQSTIDGRLRYMLAYVEEAQLLNGSGSGNNLHGIYTQATAYAAPIAIANANRIDILRLAILQSELALFPATGIVLHPSDWTAIELTKDSTGAYVFANPQSLAAPVLWGRPVVATQAMAADSFLVGAFRLGAQVFDRQQSTVLVATENEDDFIHNLVTILAEERLGLAVYRTEAFIKGDLTPAP